MEFLENHIFSVITLLIQCGLLKLVYKVFAEHKEKTEAKECALRALLRTEIINLCYKAEKDGFMPVWAVENVAEMYRVYKALGGNGAIEEMYHKAIKLPQRNH